MIIQQRMTNYIKNKVKLISVSTDDFTDYKKTAILLAFPECKKHCDGCQNEHLRSAKSHKYYINDIINLYNRLDEHKAIVCAGLDPMDSLSDLKAIILAFNENKKPVDFVIYTGYDYPDYCFIVESGLYSLITNKDFNLIIKYGHYDKNNKNKYKSNILGVELAGDNQIVVRYNLKNGEEKET